MRKTHEYKVQIKTRLTKIAKSFAYYRLSVITEAPGIRIAFSYVKIFRNGLIWDRDGVSAAI